MNKFRKYTHEYGIIVVFSLIIFSWFYFISSKTTLAGDDWAFFNNTMKDGIFDSALGMYFGWEGRLMTLFSIHTLIFNISLWKIINSLIYTLVYISIMLIIKPKYKLLSSILFILLILTIKDNIRMEVFSWITGSVYYGIPLALSFVYFSINYLVLKNKIEKFKWIFVSVSLLCAFYIPLGMENIGIAILIYTLFLNILFYIQNKKINIIFGMNLLVIFVSYVIWFLSPGSSIRLGNMPDWQKLSFIEKIFQTLPNVMFFTFYQNKYLILILSSILSIYNFIKMKHFIKFAAILFYIFSIILIFSQRIQSFMPSNEFISLMADGYSLFNTLFWIVYSIILVGNIILIDINQKEIRFSLVLLMALFSSAPLIMSPVIGYRLIVYPFFYLCFLIIMILNEFEFPRNTDKALFVILFVISIYFGNQLRYKYNLVEAITNERLAILSDYQIYADQYKDGIWLPRYPIFTIHGGDIEIEDTYHMNAFKKYFNIPMDEIITFYWKDSY